MSDPVKVVVEPNVVSYEVIINADREIDLYRSMTPNVYLHFRFILNYVLCPKKLITVKHKLRSFTLVNHAKSMKRSLFGSAHNKIYVLGVTMTTMLQLRTEIPQTRVNNKISNPCWLALTHTTTEQASCNEMLLLHPCVDTRCPGSGVVRGRDRRRLESCKGKANIVVDRLIFSFL